MRHHYIKDARMARKWVEKLQSSGSLGVDIETTGLDPHTSQIRLFQAATLQGDVAVFDLFHISCSILQPLAKCRWWTFNGQFEWQHLTNAGIDVPLLDDLMLLNRLHSHKINKLADLVPGMDKSQQLSDWSAPDLSDEQIKYAAIDALATIRRAYQLQQSPLVPWDVYQLWRDALPVLARSTLDGQTFDWDTHAGMVEAWQQDLDEQKQIVDQYMPGINLRSGKQVGEWLRANLPNSAIRRWKKTPTGQLSTGREAFERFPDLEITAPILQYKRTATALSSFGPNYTKHRNPITSRIHPDYNIGRAVTGRLTCSNPNAQQAPKGDFRKLYTAPEGHLLVGADFSQIELRVIALLAKDETMINDYANGVDLHRKTAATMAGVPIDQVTAEQRQNAKPINFGMLYGMSPGGMVDYARSDYGVQMTEQQANDAINAFARTYPSINAWQRDQADIGQRDGKVQTRLGLVRDFEVQGSGRRYTESLNMPVQGSAAEVVLASLANLNRPVYNNIHDEILLAVPADEVDQAMADLEEAMRDGFMQIFPEGEGLLNNLVEISTGPTWAQAH